MLPERVEGSMPYSDDLRRKLVDAWLTGEHTQIELAELFHVSLGWVEKVLRRWRESGDTAAAPFHHGRYPLVLPERVRRLVARHDDATLAELGRRLRVSAPTLCRYLQRLGLPRKKDAACQRARHPSGPAVAGALATNASWPRPAPTHFYR